MFVTYNRTEFHVPRSDNAPAIPIKQKTKEDIFTTAMLLFHIPQKPAVTEMYSCMNCYRKLLQDPK